MRQPIALIQRRGSGVFALFVRAVHSAIDMTTPEAVRTFSVDSASASFLGRRTTATSYGTRRGTRILTCDEFELAMDDYVDTTTAATASQSVTQDDEDIAILADEQQQVQARPSTQRTVRSSDQQLLAMAVEASDNIPWDTIRGDLLTAASQWKREKVAVDTDAAVFSRKNASTDSLNILGVCEIPCCVQELLQVFYMERTSEFMDIMRSIHGKSFLHGELVHSADPQQLNQRQRSGTRSKRSGTYIKPPENIQLTVKTLTFDKANVFRRNEEWLYVELLEQCSDPQRQRVAFARTLRTFSSCEILTDSDWNQYVNKPRHVHNVVIGYRFDEEPNGRSTRIQFYAEHKLSGSHGSSAASYRMVKSRLLLLAQSSPALMQIIRRRRLGVQVLAHSSLAVSATSRSRCARCTQSFAMLKKKRICNLCGHLVCEKCSSMQERERTLQSRPRIDSVRVCKRCLDRMDAGQFRHVSKHDLKPVHVQDDTTEYSGSPAGSHKQPKHKQQRPESSLRPSTMTEQKKSKLALLLEETLRAASDSKKVAVLNVMQDLLEQEPHYQRASMVPPPSVVLSPDRSIEDQINAFTMELKIHNLPLKECVLANNTTRNYTISPEEDPTVPLPKPISPNEAHRLELVKQLRIKELNEIPELGIVCAMAAKELDCAASLVTIVDQDSFHVVASNIEQYASQTMLRHEGFCMQLIMDDKPLVVPHPEADIRFSQLRVIASQQCNFYCGFPLRAADNTVIGSVCCVDPQSRQLTRSQYSAMMRLAETASKIVQRTTATHQLR